MQKNPSERMCKFNTAMDMYIYGHNRMIIKKYDYEHIIISSCIIYIEKATVYCRHRIKIIQKSMSSICIQNK